MTVLKAASSATLNFIGNLKLDSNGNLYIKGGILTESSAAELA